MAASNATAARFPGRLVETAPFTAGAVQADCGSEFEAEFETACRERGIMVAVLPPKSLKQHGCVERILAT